MIPFYQSNAITNPNRTFFTLNWSINSLRHFKSHHSKPSKKLDKYCSVYPNTVCLFVCILMNKTRSTKVHGSILPMIIHASANSTSCSYCTITSIRIYCCPISVSTLIVRHVSVQTFNFNKKKNIEAWVISISQQKS